MEKSEILTDKIVGKYWIKVTKGLHWRGVWDYQYKIVDLHKLDYFDDSGNDQGSKKNYYQETATFLKDTTKEDEISNFLNTKKRPNTSDKDWVCRLLDREFRKT